MGYTWISNESNVIPFKFLRHDLQHGDAGYAFGARGFSTRCRSFFILTAFLCGDALVKAW